MYAFSGFSIYNVFFFHFHEPMIVFPLLLAALDSFLLRQKARTVCRGGICSRSYKLLLFCRTGIFCNRLLFGNYTYKKHISLKLRNFTSRRRNTDRLFRLGIHSFAVGGLGCWAIRVLILCQTAGIHWLQRTAALLADCACVFLSCRLARIPRVYTRFKLQMGVGRRLAADVFNDGRHCLFTTKKTQLAQKINSAFNPVCIRSRAKQYVPAV